MDWKAHIGIDAGVLGGKPVIRGTRLAVDFIVGLLAQGWTFEQVLDSYPGITREQILACLHTPRTRSAVSGCSPRRVRLLANENMTFDMISTPSPEAVARVVADALEEHPGWEGAFSVVEDARIRRRQLP